MTRKIYIAAEPDKQQVWLDQTGKYWKNRDDAINANFNTDVNNAIEEICKHNVKISDIVKIFIKKTSRNSSGFA